VSANGKMPMLEREGLGWERPIGRAEKRRVTTGFRRIPHPVARPSIVRIILKFRFASGDGRVHSA
jgi:hypothetical protein